MKTCDRGPLYATRFKDSFQNAATIHHLPAWPAKPLGSEDCKLSSRASSSGLNYVSTLASQTSANHLVIEFWRGRRQRRQPVNRFRGSVYFSIDNMEIYDVEPFLLLPAVPDLRPLARETYLVAASYPLLLARFAAQISPWPEV